MKVKLLISQDKNNQTKYTLADSRNPRRKISNIKINSISLISDRIPKLGISSNAIDWYYKENKVKLEIELV